MVIIYFFFKEFLKHFRDKYAVSSTCSLLQESKPVSPALCDNKFFNRLENDVSRIVQCDKRRKQYSNSAGHEVNTSSEQEQVRLFQYTESFTVLDPVARKSRTLKSEFSFPLNLSGCEN